MNKKLLTAIALLGILAVGAVAQADIIWDQSDYDINMQSWYDSVSGCPPFGFTVHSANDIHVWDTSTITTITTWYTPFNGGTGAATQAHLYIAPKTGPLPIDGVDLPQENGTLVTITATPDPNTGFWVITASGLSVTLTAGDYWVSLTPILPGGPWGADTHVRSMTTLGDPAAYYQYCGAGSFVWTVLPEPIDLSILIEGTVGAVPVESTTWGDTKALFR